MGEQHILTCIRLHFEYKHPSGKQYKANIYSAGAGLVEVTEVVKN